jgi:hypothetical protein
MRCYALAVTLEILPFLMRVVITVVASMAAAGQHRWASGAILSTDKSPHTSERTLIVG